MEQPGTPEHVLPRVHSNAMSATGGPFDVALDFGYRPAGDKLDIEWQVRVTMSWEHLATMLPHLQQLVQQFEESVGALPDVAKAAEAVQGQPQ